MGSDDIDKRFRNVSNSKTFTRIITHLSLDKKRVLDIGCCYGEHLALFGPDSMGITTNPQEADYAKEKGTLITKGNAEELESVTAIQAERFDAIWANNLFEHLLAPHQFLNTLRRYARNDTQLVLGVPVVPSLPFLMNFRKFRGALATAHINFFTKTTLRLSVECAGWDIIEARPFIFSNSLLDHLAGFIAPHIYVVARNNPAFLYSDKKLAEWNDDPYYSTVLKTTGQ